MRDWAHSRRLGTPADEAGSIVLRQPPASKLANLFRIDVRDLANQHGLSGLRGFGPEAFLRSAPATPASFPIIGSAGARWSSLETLEKRNEFRSTKKNLGGARQWVRA